MSSVLVSQARTRPRRCSTTRSAAASENLHSVFAMQVPHGVRPIGDIVGLQVFGLIQVAMVERRSVGLVADEALEEAIRLFVGAEERGVCAVHHVAERGARDGAVDPVDRFGQRRAVEHATVASDHETHDAGHGDLHHRAGDAERFVHVGQSRGEQEVHAAPREFGHLPGVEPFGFIGAQRLFGSVAVVAAAHEAADADFHPAVLGTRCGCLSGTPPRPR